MSIYLAEQDLFPGPNDFGHDAISAEMIEPNASEVQ